LEDESFEQIDNSIDNRFSVAVSHLNQSFEPLCTMPIDLKAILGIDDRFCDGLLCLPLTMLAAKTKNVSMFDC
jgi:hypothetical protein